MSKINQIQNKLLELSGGAFQKLADSYLLKKGYPQVNPIGSVIGSDKVRKGTPDTLIPLANGRYVFAEHTTQKKGVFQKYTEDLEKCFDEKKTGISTNKIQEIVLCHTTEFSPDERNSLGVLCEKYQIILNVFGIGTISYDLLDKFPGIAKGYLGVEVDTGQIIPVDEFIIAYSKNKLATRLNTTFHFRESEIEQAETALEETDLIIISGSAGVGKSRLALECSERFKQKYPSFNVLCIFNRGVDLFDDIQVYFSEPGNFLILVDDANRISGFQYIIQRLLEQRDDQKIKVIVTVRDYALSKTKEVILPYGQALTVNLLPLSDKQIKELCEKEYEIKNHLYLTRIAEIAQGNPRLAIMASEVAKEKNTLDSIRDVSQLYEKYYASIRTHLDALKDKKTLEVIGIVSFFRSIDQSDNGLMPEIQRVFKLSKKEFWNICQVLHDMEIFDIHENEVVKVSEQVLSTYLFYVVFFKEKILDFALLLNHFFPRFRSRLLDAINPVLSAFDSKEVMEKMRPAVEPLWSRFESDGSRSDFLQVVEVFWFLKKTDTLIYIKSQIDKMEAKEIEIDNIKFEADSNSSSSPLLKLLSGFKYTDKDFFGIALDLFFDYLEKQPDKTQEVLRSIVDFFGYEADSYATGFHVQYLVIEKLSEKAQQGKKLLFSKLFVAVSQKYLHTHCSDSKWDQKNTTVNLIQFDLSATPPLLKFRQKIWRELFSFFQTQKLQEDILNLLSAHASSGRDVSSNEIIKKDSVEVLSFFKTELERSNFDHAVVVHQYLNLLSRVKVPFDPSLKSSFENEKYALYLLLTSNWLEDAHRTNIPRVQYEELKNKKINSHTKHFTIEDYCLLLNHAFEISQSLINDWKIQQLRSGVETSLICLSKKDPKLFLQVVSEYLKQGNLLKLNPYVLVQNLVSSSSIRDSFKLLIEQNFPCQRRWLFRFHSYLPKNAVNSEYMEQLIELYREAEVGDYPSHLDFILKYCSIDKMVIIKVAKIILEKAETEPRHTEAFSLLFDSHSESHKAIRRLLIHEIDLFERAYLLIIRMDQHVDYDGKVFAEILDADPHFPNKFIDEMFQQKQWLNSYDDERDYSFIWARADYKHIVNQLAERIFKYERKNYHYAYFETFFTLTEEAQRNNNPKEKQDRFIKWLVTERNSDLEFMKFLFTTIASFTPDRRRELITHFVKYNNDINDFEKLNLEPTISSSFGSAVPMLQGKIKYYESLLPLFNTIGFLKHKQHIEQEIMSIRSRIQREKKMDFRGFV